MFAPSSSTIQKKNVCSHLRPPPHSGSCFQIRKCRAGQDDKTLAKTLFSAINVKATISRGRWERHFENLHPAANFLRNAPHRITLLLVVANAAIFAGISIFEGSLFISPKTLFRLGAIYPGAISQGEYWRQITYGFLHSDILHLLSNMICLLLWGGILERQLSIFYFTTTFMSSIAIGGVVEHIHASYRFHFRRSVSSDFRRVGSLVGPTYSRQNRYIPPVFPREYWIEHRFDCP